MPTKTYKHPNACPKCGQWPKPTLTVDGIITKEAKILLMKRKFPPHKGTWTLPGGHVEYGERVEAALKREVLEETGLGVSPKRIIGVYSDPKRDPRYHLIAICYKTEITDGTVRQSDETDDLQWFPFNQLPNLGFDHGQMVDDFLKGNRA